MEQVKDIYDEQIERLTANPREIFSEWFDAIGLFKKTGGSNDLNSGCLTQIRHTYLQYSAVIKGRVDILLTEAIRKDDRLPTSSSDIKVEHLPVFAEWQRKIDKLQNS
jgi:hypothetical protein